MKDIYLALWNRKDGRDLDIDELSHASFDLDECARVAYEHWWHQTKREQSIYSLSVLRYSYDESLEDEDEAAERGYDCDAILWDGGGYDTGHSWGE